MSRSTAAARFAVAGLMFSTAPWALGQTSSGGVPALKEELLIEIDRAKGKENLLELKAIDEEIIRKDADTKFDLAIIATKQDVSLTKVDLLKEADRAKAQETLLQAKAIDEEMIRKDADTRLDLAIIATKQDVSLTKVDLLNEADRAKAAESGLLGDFTLKLNNEAAARAAAVNGVSAALTQEVTRATGAEATLTTTLNAEVARAEAAEVTLTTNLNNEITRATANEATLQNSINSESAARAAEDADTLAAAKAYADTRPGPQGPAGAPGAGLMATWSWFPNASTFQPIYVESGSERKRIIAVTIPQDGNYLLFATMRYYAPAAWASIVCDIVDSRNYYTEAIANVAAIPGNPGAVWGTMTLHAGYWFPAGMVVEAACSLQTPTQVTAQFDQLLLSAILVNDLRAGTPEQ